MPQGIYTQNYAFSSLHLTFLYIYGNYTQNFHKITLVKINVITFFLLLLLTIKHKITPYMQLNVTNLYFLRWILWTFPKFMYLWKSNLKKKTRKKNEITLKKFTSYNLTCLFALYFPTERNEEKKAHPTRETAF